MRCFNHNDREAIGSCKSCSKGLCVECAVDLGHGLACKNAHEQAVETLDAIVQRSARIYSVTPKSTGVAPMFYAFMGVVFAGFGFARYEDFFNLPVIMGAGFIVFAVVVYVINRRAFGSGNA